MENFFNWLRALYTTTTEPTHSLTPSVTASFSTSYKSVNTQWCFSTGSTKEISSSRWHLGNPIRTHRRYGFWKEA